MIEILDLGDSLHSWLKSLFMTVLQKRRNKFVCNLEGDQQILVIV